MSDDEIAKKIGKTSRGVMEQRNMIGLFRIRKDYSKYENIAKFFRGHIQNWKVNSMKNCNYRCILTGSKDFAIHHIISFNIILENVFSVLETRIDLRST